jgi:hypothetical protein
VYHHARRKNVRVRLQDALDALGEADDDRFHPLALPPEVADLLKHFPGLGGRQAVDDNVRPVGRLLASRVRLKFVLAKPLARRGG